jgi:hypothetical protein
MNYNKENRKVIFKINLRKATGKFKWYFLLKDLKRKGFPVITRSSVVSKANDGVGPYFNIKRIDTSPTYL